MLVQKIIKDKVAENRRERTREEEKLNNIR